KKSSPSSTGCTSSQCADDESRDQYTHATEFVEATANQNRAVRSIHDQSRYLKIVHADDWLYPECLERMTEVPDAHPSVGAISSFRLVGTHVEHESALHYPDVVIPAPALV